MGNKITNLQVEEFLRSFEVDSETYILEEGAKKNEIIEIAKARGINLKNNRDLAGFKTIYTFANKANENKARLPKDILLKALPSMVGKPIDIDHNRRYVIGAYLDYRYKKKEDMVIAYGVFYKSNFGEEWEEAKKLFKAKKLATSYEIWCPEDKRKDLDDGTYELLTMEIAGGALIYNEKPAFPQAKVLELAKVHSEDISKDLVYASKYKEEEIIVCKKNECKLVKAEESFNCECLKCGHKMKTNQHCNSVKCPKCGGEMRRADRPGTGRPDKSPNAQSQPSKIKCSNCSKEFEYVIPSGIQKNEIKCPQCKAILNKEGKMIYPPQVQDFRILCPSCKTNRWLITSRVEAGAHLKCLQCSKEYKIQFARPKNGDIISKVGFIYTGRINCYQCQNPIYYAGISTLEGGTLNCKRCGLTFPFSIAKGENYKQIGKIQEIIKAEKTSEEGGQKMDYVITLGKYHRYAENVEVLEKAVAEIDIFEGKKEKAKELTTKQRNALPDKMFAVVVRVKNKKTGKMRKIRMFPIHDEAHVRNALARLGQEKPKATLKKLGVSIEKVKAKILKRARELKMKDLLKRYEKSKEVKKPIKSTEKSVVREEAKKVEKPVEASKTSDVDKYTKALSKAVDKVVGLKTAKSEAEQKSEKLTATVDSLQKELETAKKNAEQQVAFYKANAVEINKRREDLGLEFSKELSDIDILDDKKFANAKAKQENVKIQKSSQTVGDKTQDSDYYKSRRDAITKEAFKHLNK